MELILNKKTPFTRLKEAGELGKRSKVGLDIGVKCVLEQAVNPDELTEESLAKVKEIVSKVAKKLKKNVAVLRP